MKFDRRDLMIGPIASITAYPFISEAQTETSKRSWVPGDRELEALHQAMRTYQVPGAQIAVIEDGDVAWQKAFGVTNIETGVKVTDRTLFQGGSLTKPLFAYVVMRLIEEKRLRLDDRLSDFYRPDDYVPSEWNDAITVRHALAHQTGLPNWRSRGDEDVVLQPDFEPGSGYAYSGEAYYWLQEVCETITDLSLQELLAKYIFEPANLFDMAALWLPENDCREAYGHVLDNNEKTVLSDIQFTREHGRHLQQIAERWGRPMTSWRSPDLRAAQAVMKPHPVSALADRPSWRWKRSSDAIINSAYTLRTTARDYARFISTMLPGQPRSDWNINEATRQMMLTPHTEQSGKHRTRPAGLGWSLERWGGSLYFGHTGISGSRHISIAFSDPDRRRGLVMMTNSETGGLFIHNMAIFLTGTHFQTFN